MSEETTHRSEAERQARRRRFLTVGVVGAVVCATLGIAVVEPRLGREFGEVGLVAVVAPLLLFLVWWLRVPNGAAQNEAQGTVVAPEFDALRVEPIVAPNAAAFRIRRVEPSLVDRQGYLESIRPPDGDAGVPPNPAFRRRA